MRVIPGARGSVMGFMTSCIHICCQAASTSTKTMAHNIYVTKLVEPEVIHCACCGHKVSFAELFVRLRGSDVQLV
jgi:hypothetical protein